MNSERLNGGLSQAQYQILQGLVTGLPHKEIADTIGMKLKTMEFHIYAPNPNSIESLFKVKGLAAIVRRALEIGVKPIKGAVVHTPLPHPIKTTSDLADALMRAATAAAEGKCDPVQVGCLCQATSAIILLARLQMEVRERQADGGGWLKDV